MVFCKQNEGKWTEFVTLLPNIKEHEILSIYTNNFPTKMIRISFYLLLSVFRFPSDLFAQQKKIDSLNKILMQNNLADSVRLKSLIK
jgi:hypothetical protein